MPTLHSNDSPNADSKDEGIRFVFDSESFHVSEIDEFTFLTACEPLVVAFEPDRLSKQFEGSIEYGGESIQFDFRIRRIEGDSVRCGFYDLPIKLRETVISLRDQAQSGTSDELHALTYDELAKGNTSKTSTSKTSNKPATTAHPKSASTLKKAIAMIVLLAAMAAIIGWVVIVVQSRSTVSVSNSVLVGNYQPVNTPLEGKLLEVLVEVGDHVVEGQPLAILSNDEPGNELILVEAQLKRAKGELAAYQVQSEKILTLMGYATAKAKRDLAVAEAELVGGKAKLDAANAQMNRLQPLAAKGNIGLFEIEEAKAIVAECEANLIRQQALIETFRLSQTAAAKNVFVGASGVSDPLAEVTTKIALAKAALAEASQLRDHLSQQCKPTELTAPRSGVVYAIYKRPGEFLKSAEQAVAISLNKAGWATGHIAPELASSVRPGQPVEIEIPSMGIETTGKVTGVGHRSVYGRGGYNAEFRGVTLSVPIRVELDDIDQNVPSGLRLNMTVRLRDNLAEMRKWFQSFGKDNEATTSVEPPPNAL